MSTKIRGYIMYEGPSMIDRKPIVVIVTLESTNTKTGVMASMWILAQNESPIDAYKSGADKSICGDCKLRWATGGACYVNIGQAPLSIWRAYKRGAYPKHVDPDFVRFAGMKMRFGAYGDPYAVPAHILRGLQNQLKLNTSYTHQWKETTDAVLMETSMASADSYDEGVQARSEGWRTYRVTHDIENLHPDEIICPHYTHGVQCDACKLCGGTSVQAKSIVAPAHGSRAKRFIED